MIKKLRDYLETNQLDGYFIAKKVNVRYLSGYTGDDAYLFITKNKQYLVTDPRYTEQAGIECPTYEVINWRLPGKTIGDSVALLAAENQLERLGFEADQLSYERFRDIQDQAVCQLIPQTGVIENFREIKRPWELDLLRGACDIACRAFERILPEIKVGVTEKELAAKLALLMVQEGADTQPYGNILISGAKTSLLHGIPSDKAIEYGDFVLLDFGCQYKGYLSDMTRTVVVGKASEKQREVYRLEQEMTAAATALIKPGSSLRDCYQASIEAIKGTPYFDYHYPNIGHGIGLFLHESPSITFQSQEAELFQVGQVVTIEPGLYLPGWGGVRIEDQLIVTEGGHENLIWLSHDLIEL